MENKRHWFSEALTEFKCLLILLALCLSLMPWPIKWFPHELGLYLGWANSNKWANGLSILATIMYLISALHYCQRSFWSAPSIAIITAIVIVIIYFSNTNQGNLASIFIPWMLFFIGITLGKIERSIFIKLFICLIAIQMIASIIIYFVGIEQFHTPGFGQRANGTYATPNTLYPICIWALVYYLFLYCSRFRTKCSIPSLAMAGLGLLNLILTFSRAGWLGAAIGILLIKRQRPIINYIAIAISLILIIGLGFIRTHGHLATPINDRSLSGRIIVWKNATSMIKSHPWIGAGYGGYARQVQSWLYDHPNRDSISESKSLYINILVETGFIGFAAYILFFIAIIYSCKIVITDDTASDIEKINASVMQILLSAYLVSGLFDTIIFGSDVNTPVTFIFLILSGLVVASSIDSIDNKNVTRIVK